MTSASGKCRAQNPKNCYRHGTGVNAAVRNQDINAFLDAKETEAYETSSDIVLVGNKPYNVYSLVELGYDEKRVQGIFNRPIGNSELPATEKQKSLRVQCLLAEEAYDTKRTEIENKKFSPLTTQKAKKEYYHKAMTELSLLSDKVNEKADKSLIAEQTEDFSYSSMNPMRNAYAYENDGPVEMSDLPEQKNKVRIIRDIVTLHNSLQKQSLLHGYHRYL